MTAEMQSSPGEVHEPGEANTLRVTGKVKQPLVLRMEELCGMDAEEVKDLPLICGDGTPKGRIASCRGILIENVIRMAEVIKDDEEDTKRMFIIASASDGHKVVFSWQEIFNTPIGGGVMVLIERDGKSLCGEPGSLELISAEDYFTGSRYVKGLTNIEVVLVG
jgi:hypothetical protein